ncbi:D-aminoacyl-tRNA deacylase [Cuniculiplasma sp. SKW3]|uniref:D-aminoacyl-tRNA deacylase n=1 Tax=Cuniculiplasma sp. SKW3 TaxID=3400170 RepID=UPI003FD2ACFC
MKEKIAFIGTKSDDASYTIYNYFLSRDTQKERYYLVDGRLPLLADTESIVDPKYDIIVFLSRHSSEKKVNSLTVHPVGNFSRADLGGREGEICPSSPEIQTAMLRKMIELYKGEKYQVTFEATHHGPLTQRPIIFAEIGTEPENWHDPEALAILYGGVTQFETHNYNNYVAAGGGHYAPKFSSYVVDNRVNIGHIISKYRLEEITEREVEMAVEKTPKCKGFIVDKKGTKSDGYAKIKNVAAEKDLEIINI